MAVHYGASREEADELVSEIAALGRRAVALHADLAVEAEVVRLVPDCTAALGRPVCIVNNASRFDQDTAHDIGYDTLLNMTAINVGAPLVLARMLHDVTPASARDDETQRSVVINLLDQKLYNMNPDYLSYTVSKAALDAATVALAQALAPKVRVVGLAPGLTLQSRRTDAAELRRRASYDAAWPRVAARRHRGRGAVSRGRSGRDRYDAGRRRRPASRAVAARRDVLDGRLNARDARRTPRRHVAASPHRATSRVFARLFQQERTCLLLFFIRVSPIAAGFFLRNYEVNINIGVHDFEKRGEQRVVINVELFVPLAMSTPVEDKLREVVDYDFMRATIARRVEQGHIHLQETLCDDLVKIMLAHPQVRAARVSTEKPDVYPDCDAVGVEVFRIKEE